MVVGLTMRGVGLLAIAAIGSTVALWDTAAFAQQKTAKQCVEEWRANKAQNQAQGITEKAFVAQCRAGTAAAQPTAAPGQGQTAAPAAPQRPATAARTRETTAAAPAGANQFANEAQARARCPSDTVVWVNPESKIYHFSGHKDFGNTKAGAYMCERDAMAAGDRAAKNEKHP